MKSLTLLTIATLCITHAPYAQNNTLEYDKVKHSMVALQLAKKDSLAAINGDELKSQFIHQTGKELLMGLTEKIFPFWYGTQWDFNGYTSKPQEGKIACGYFVSTTLQHIGLKVNRYKLAQKDAYGIVKNISCSGKMYSYRSTTRDKFLATAKTELKEGLYVIGLDNHVGFILINVDKKIEFIHSSYREPVQVVREDASSSVALNDSKTFILTSITNNDFFIKKWINGEEVLLK